MNLSALISVLWPLAPRALPSPALRPPVDELPIRPPLLLMEEIEGGYLLSSRAFARVLPEGFAEEADRPAVQAAGRGRFFYARVPEDWLRSRDDPWPGVSHPQEWPCAPGWWRRVG